jgi:hypothetical protein
MSNDDAASVKSPDARRDDALQRLDEAAKQLEIAREKADGEWQAAAIAELRADLASLQGFRRASELAGEGR